MNKHCGINKAYENIASADCLPMPMYATAYIKYQTLNTLYNPMEGLENGTIFPELNFPYKYNPMF